MIETPTEKVVIPTEVELLAAAAAVRLLDLPLGLLILFKSVLLKHRLRRVLDIPKPQRSLLRAFAPSLFDPVMLTIPGHSNRFCNGLSSRDSLRIGVVRTGGADAADFRVSVQTATPVAASRTTTLQVTFDPGAVGLRTATLFSGIQHGIWQPDGRILATDTARTLQRGVFNGAWRLNLADLAPDGTMRLRSGSLTLSGDNGLAVVPEPGAAGAVGAGLLAFAVWRRRK